jgi:hypothetical protein
MAFVSGANGTNSTGGAASTPFTVAVTKTVTAGNTLIALVNITDTGSSTNYTTGSLTSITDNAAGGSNTYVAPASNFVAYVHGGNNIVADWVQYVQTLTGSGSLTVTAHITPNQAWTFASIVVVEYSGLGTFDVIGAMNGQDAGTYSVAANVITSGTVSVAAGDTVIGITIDWNGAGTITAGTGFTTDYNVASTYMSESLTKGSTSTIGATFTPSVTTDDWATAMLAFSAAVSNTLMPQVCM